MHGTSQKPAHHVGFQFQPRWFSVKDQAASAFDQADCRGSILEGAKVASVEQRLACENSWKEAKPLLCWPSKQPCDSSMKTADHSVRLSVA